MTLMQWGADPFARTNAGHTAADMAIFGDGGDPYHDLANAVELEAGRMERLLAFGMAGQQRLGSESEAAGLFGVQEIFRMVVEPDYLDKKPVVEL